MLVHVALLLVQLAFASGAIVGRLAFSPEGHLDPTALAFVRASVGALGFQVVSRAVNAPTARKEPLRHGRLVVLGILGVVVNQAFFLHGLKRGTAGAAGLFAVMIPVFAAALGVLAGREKPRVRTMLGIGVATTGVLVLTGVRDISLGNLLFAINSFAYATYLVVMVPDVRRHGPMRTIAWVFTWGAILLAPVGLPALVHDVPRWHLRDVEVVAWFVCVPTLFAYFTNAWALGRAKPSVVATYVYMQPLLILFAAGKFLGEVFSPRIAVASVAILVGVAIVVFRTQKADGPSEGPADTETPEIQASK